MLYLRSLGASVHRTWQNLVPKILPPYLKRSRLLGCYLTTGRYLHETWATDKAVHCLSLSTTQNINVTNIRLFVEARPWPHSQVSPTRWESMRVPCGLSGSTQNKSHLCSFSEERNFVSQRPIWNLIHSLSKFLTCNGEALSGNFWHGNLSIFSIWVFDLRVRFCGFPFWVWLRMMSMTCHNLDSARTVLDLFSSRCSSNASFNRPSLRNCAQSSCKRSSRGYGARKLVGRRRGIALCRVSSTKTPETLLNGTKFCVEP